VCVLGALGLVASRWSAPAVTIAPSVILPATDASVASADAGRDAAIVPHDDDDDGTPPPPRTRITGRARPDAGTRRTPGGLAGPDEIYGEPR
jgi:hypothetical protein